MKDIAPGYYMIYVSIIYSLLLFYLSSDIDDTNSTFHKDAGITALVPLSERSFLQLGPKIESVSVI